MFGVTPAAPADSAMFVPFDIPGALHTRGHGINPAGQIVGSYVDSDQKEHGFLLRNGVFALLSAGDFDTIDIPGARLTRPRAINSAGQIVGVYVDAAAIMHGFLLSGDSLTVLDFPGADYSSAMGINTGGDVVGFYGMGGTEHGFLWNQDTGFTTVDYPGAFLTNARGINPNGDIVGLYCPTKAGITTGRMSHAFIRNFDGTYTTKDVPGAITPSGNAVNAAGEIVGSAFCPGLGNCGFLLTEGGVRLFQNPGARVTQPFGFNPDGWIVGFHVSGVPNQSVMHGFLVHRSSLV
jgi:uncharacterized membrane protein